MSRKIRLKFDPNWQTAEPEHLVYWPASQVPLNPKFTMEKNGKLIAKDEIIFESFPQEDAQDDFNYFIGYVEPDSKKILCRPAKISRMFPNYSFKEIQDETENDEKTKLTTREQMNELRGKFGSKRTQRDLANKRKYEIQFGEADAEDLPTIQNTQTPSPTNGEKNKAVKNEDDQQPLSSILPPRKDDAESIYQVYSVSDIITDPEMEAIENYEDQLFDLIKNEYIKQLGSKTIERRHRVMAIYADALLQMVKLSAAQMRRPDPLPDLVGDLKKLLFDRYTMTKTLSNRQLQYVITEKNKDRIYIHIFILALMLNNYKPIELDKMQKMCEVKPGHVRRIFELIGCYIENEKKSRGSVSRVAELRLPLNTFQNEKKRQRRA